MTKPSRVYDPELIDEPDVSHLVTEDDQPVDNIASEKQQRLLTEPLYSSWSGPGEGRIFLVAANVGLFPAIHQPPLVPDVFLSLDVKVADDWWAKYNRAYFVWEFGKVPEVVIELVSNLVGNETGTKFVDYARIGVPYYAIYDAQRLIQPTSLCVYELRGRAYELRPDGRLPDVGLGLVLWEGVFEGKHSEWVRFCDESGRVIPTGAERAADERRRADEHAARADEAGRRADEAGRHADEAGRRAEDEHGRAEIERVRAHESAKLAERLAARLRALGLDPDAED